MNQLPEMCPGSHEEPHEPSTCPACQFVWVNVKFEKVTPTHGIVTPQQEQNVEWWTYWRLNTV